jgi:succinoglycan biosynthesis protein ExoA
MRVQCLDTTDFKEPMVDSKIPCAAMGVSSRSGHAGAQESWAVTRPGKEAADALGKKESGSRPLISVILAIRNEALTIQSCLNSLLEQENQDFDVEILAIDGNSTDGTWELLQELASHDRRIRVLRNEKQRTPFAFNLGLREAKGDFVAILGAHTLYARNYLSVCLRELMAQDAVACGGRVITKPAGNTLEARLVAIALCHPFGSSRKSFRTQPEGFVDTVNYPVMRKSALIQAGGYDEELLRNQDNDMSQRLRGQGRRLYCTWKTHCIYHPKGTLRELMTYAYGNGYWNVVSWKKNRAAMGARHFIPFLFVVSLLGAGLFALAGAFLKTAYAGLAVAPLILLFCLYLAAAVAGAIQTAIRQKWPGALWLPAVFFGFHFSYGFGTLRAILAGARPRSTELRNIGGRPDYQEVPMNGVSGPIGAPTMEDR